MDMDDRMQRFGSTVAILSCRTSYHKSIGLYDREKLTSDRICNKVICCRSRHLRSHIVWIYQLDHMGLKYYFNDKR